MEKRAPPPGSTSPSVLSCPLLLFLPRPWPQPPVSPPVNLSLWLPLPCSQPSHGSPAPQLFHLALDALHDLVLSFLCSHHFPIHIDCVISTQNSSF